jgi:hypothetical protein
MGNERESEKSLRWLSERAANARLRAGVARTSQEREHFEGLASNLEELLRERKTSIAGGPATAELAEMEFEVEPR